MAFIPDEAVDRMTEISAGAWKLYTFLCRCRNQKTGKCCPSVHLTMETIGIKRSQTYEFRKELVRAGWAVFDGNNVISLFGFNIPKSRTTNSDNKEDSGNSPKSRNIPKSRTDQSEISDNFSEIPDKTVRNPGLAYKEEPAKEPAKRTNVGATAPDTRTQHVAIQACRQVAKSYPPKELWDKIIQVLGEKPNTSLLVECRAEWVERGYNRASWKWATEWYATGVPARIVASPPKQNNAAYVGAHKPIKEKPVNAEDLAFMNEYIDGLIAAEDLIHIGDEYDAILERGGAKLDWEIRLVAWYELRKDEPATPEIKAELNRQITELAKR